MRTHFLGGCTAWRNVTHEIIIFAEKVKVLPFPPLVPLPHTQKNKPLGQKP